MSIAYNKDGLPFIIDEEGTIIDFTPENMNFLIGELSIDKESIDKIFVSLKKSVDQKILEYQKVKKENFSDLKDASYILYKIGQYATAIDICQRAEDYYYMLSTPKPYNTWVWDSAIREWIAPYQIPFGSIDQYYKWDDTTITWVPAEDNPGEEYFWSTETHSWEPIIPYPIDAAPGEFIWDIAQGVWILNDKKA